VQVVEVFYTCKGCGLVDVPVTVAHRKEGEDVVDWMHHVQIRVYVDHAAKMSLCTSLVDVKIPVEDDKGLGMP
jgi:hypothetical protein